MVYIVPVINPFIQPGPTSRAFYIAGLLGFVVIPEKHIVLVQDSLIPCAAE